MLKLNKSVMNQNTKDIYQYAEVKDRILSGLSKLSQPIVQTLTPKGKNVLYQGLDGRMYTTNDGFTIAKHIILKDTVENAVVEIVKNSAFKTNSVAGDGTTTSILLSDTLIRNGFRLIENGMNPMDLKHYLDEVSTILVEELTKAKIAVKTDSDLHFIAKVSANNDEDIALNVVKVVKRAGQDGLVFIEDQAKDSVDIIEENGFVVETGMFSPYLANKQGTFTASYETVPVFICDKRLYYEEEVIAILRAVAEMGENKVVIIASDFIGQAPNILIANHLNEKINMNILLIKESDPEVLDDLATYLNGQVTLDKNGSFVGKLNKDSFVYSKKVFSDNRRTIVLSENKKNVALALRLDAIRGKLKEIDEETQEGQKLKRRLACLTNGITTIRIGGKTVPEVKERLLRYEDSINATRNASKEGYVTGGGTTLWNTYQVSKKKLSVFPAEIQDLVQRFCQASLKQIAENCNVHFPTMLENVKGKNGYNAVTGKYEDLHTAGIIEPFLVVKMTVENSISVAQVLLSADFLIINQVEDNNEK